MSSDKRFSLLLAACLGAALCVLAGRALAAEFYVTPSGAGDRGGTNWDNAYSNVQTAASLATNAGGDTIFLQWGVYSNASQVVISNAPNVMLRGGCNGLSGGSSNEYSGTNSTLTKTGGVMRIVSGYASTATWSGVTISGGYFTNGENYGAGMCFTNCAITLTNCVVSGNTNLCSSASGGGVYSAGGYLTVNGCLFSNNICKTISGSGAQRVNGGSISASGPSLIVNGSMFRQNQASYELTTPFNSAYGGAIFDNCATALISDCVFDANSAQARQSSGTMPYGGALFLTNSLAAVSGCAFSNNFTYGTYPASGGNLNGQGGAIYAAKCALVNLQSNVWVNNSIGGTALVKNGAVLYVFACQTCLVADCTIDSQGVSPAAEYVTLNGVTNMQVTRSVFRNNSASNAFVVSGANLSFADSVIANNMGPGIYASGANLVTMTNCLVAGNISDGLSMGGGTTVLVNCTLADNGGWGLNQSGGTGTVLNSIAWGNTAGGFPSNVAIGVNYSCPQTAPCGGTNNVLSDPQFAPVPGCYYLSVAGLTNQAASSPCINAGSNTAAYWGLDGKTTRTDGTNDMTGNVDMGYHYTSGVPASMVLALRTNCCVDAVNGADTNDGLSWASAWKSLTKALSNVAAGATIHVATGTYNSASGETFPLTVPRANLTIAASNADPALTVLDNAGTNGQRVLQAAGKGTLALRGLTFRGGCFTNGLNYGAGLYFLNCKATLTNCVVRENTNLCDVDSFGGIYFGMGGGLYSAGDYGCLTVAGCLFSNNACSTVGSDSPRVCGGAIYASGSNLAVSSTTFRQNQAAYTTGSGLSWAYGGAIYGSCAWTLLSDCIFDGNYAAARQSSSSMPYGGALYLTGSVVTVAGCTFTNNSTYGTYTLPGQLNGQGGAVYLGGGALANFLENVFIDNAIGGSATVKNGAAIYASGCQTCLVSHCTMDSRGTNPAAEYVNLIGASLAQFAGSTLRNNSASNALLISGATVVAMTNCLIVKNGSDGIRLGGGPATFVNCTFANNAGWGIARPASAGMTVKNSIFWGNSYGGIGHNQNLTLTYTDSQDEWAAVMGAGNFSSDPLFADAAGGDYHEMGKEGSYHGGLWTPDGRNSSCLDAGDPASDWSLETKPCGNRINLGAYGNTAEATRSMPKRGTVMRIY